jgi:hypothetical protein
MSQPAVRPAPSGPLVWAATFGSIAAWMVHLTAEAALVPAREAHPDVVWLMHGLTVVLALVVLAGMRVSWTLARLGADDEGAGSPGGRTVFLGYLGLLVGGLNLALILYEELLVAVWNKGIRN